MILERFLYILLVLSIALPVQAASPYGRFHALVIGNQNYKDLKSLKTPIADAKAMAEVLQNRYGFEVELVLDGNRKEIMRAFSTLRKTMTSEKDNLLIYYAGHGYLDRLSGVGYWQPVDAEQDNDIDWIPTSRVTNLLKVIQAKHALVVADSCYSGNLLMRESKAQLASGMERNAWQQRMLERRSRNALTSGGEEPVLDSGGGGHSVFAKAFLDVLRGNREIMDGDSLFDLIKNPVIANARQTPLYGVINMTGHDWGDFLLVPEGLQGRKLVGKQESKKERDFARRGSEADMTSVVEPIRPKPILPEPVKKQKPVTVTAPKQRDTIASIKFISEALLKQKEPPVVAQTEKRRKDDFAKRGKLPQEDKTIGQYIDHGDGTVTDTGTGLMWKRCSEGLSGDNCEHSKVKGYTWDDTTQRFKNVDYAGYSDWRLPTIEELKTLVYCSEGKNKGANWCSHDSGKPAINRQAFPNTEATFYWSRSPLADDSDYAWILNFYDGLSSAGYRLNYYAVRLVRGGQ